MDKDWIYDFLHVKDIIALCIVITWCISIFLPEHFVDAETMNQFERIMLLILGFYFGRTAVKTKGKKEEPADSNIGGSDLHP